MPKVPIINQEVESRSIGAPQITANMREVGNPYRDNGAGQATEKINSVITKIQADARQKANETAMIDFQRQLDDYEATSIYGENGALTKKGKDAFDLPEKYMPEYDKFSSGLLNKLGNDEQKMAAAKAIQSKRSSLNMMLHRQMRQESDIYHDETAAAGIAAKANLATLNPTDPTVVDQSLRGGFEIIESRAKRKGIPPDSPILSQQKIKYESMVQAKRLKTMLKSDNPDTVLQASEMLADMRVKGAMTQAQAIDFIIDRLENTPEVTEDGKGYVRWGINSEAHPELYRATDGFKTFTREQAASVYKKEYWEAIEADKLPENIRLMAFDAAVNNGLGNAKKWLEASGGDPAKFEQLRLAHFEKLGGENLQGWKNRMATVSDYSRSQILAEDADEVQKVVDLALPKAQAQKAYASMGDQKPEDAAKDLGADAKEEFYKILKRQQDIKEEGLKQQQNEASERALDAIDAGGDPSVDDLLVLTEDQRKKIDYHYKLVNGMVAMTPADEEARNIYFDDLMKKYTENPKSILEPMVSDLRTRLNPDDLETVMDWRLKAGGDDDKSKLFAASEGEKNKVILSYSEGFRKAVPNQDKPAFDRAMRQAIVREEKIKNRNLTVEEMYTIGDRLAQQVVFKGFAKNKLAYKITSEDDLSKTVVPDNWRKDFLDKYYRRFGREAEPPSEDDMHKVYNMTLGGSDGE